MSLPPPTPEAGAPPGWPGSPAIGAMAWGARAPLVSPAAAPAAALGGVPPATAAWPPAEAAPVPVDGCAGLAQLAAIGAVVGASAAAGASLRRLQRGEITAGEAFADTGRAALASGAASAAAGAAASAVAGQGLVRLGVLFAAGTAVMYGIQRSLEAE